MKMENCTFENMKEYIAMEPYSEIDIQADHLQDCYTLMYGFLGKALMEQCGVDGDAALREATRRYGRDRGIKDRDRHLAARCKVNMYSNFNIGGGLPGNKRTSSYRFKSTPQQHVSHVLTCPMADIWDAYGMMEIGRIYCEEFHYAYYNSYGFGKTKVYLGSTLTERGAQYCNFNVILRPADLSEEIRGKCFEEYDKENTQPDLSGFVKENAQEGYRYLYLRLYYYILECACEQLGERGRGSVAAGLRKMAESMAVYLEKSCEKEGKTMDQSYVELNYPVLLDTEKEVHWQEYSGWEARELLQWEFCDNLKKYLKIENC